MICTKNCSVYTTITFTVNDIRYTFADFYHFRQFYYHFAFVKVRHYLFNFRMNCRSIYRGLEWHSELSCYPARERKFFFFSITLMRIYTKGSLTCQPFNFKTSTTQQWWQIKTAGMKKKLPGDQSATRAHTDDKYKNMKGTKARRAISIFRCTLLFLSFEGFFFRANGLFSAGLCGEITPDNYSQEQRAA